MSFTSPFEIEYCTSLYNFHTSIAVLRLDRMHPQVSGNKWFKLRFYLDEALRAQKSTLVTFGGAYSNHLLATAAAASLHQLNSIGIVRGDDHTTTSPTLIEARELGMWLVYTDRGSYRAKHIPAEVLNMVSEKDLLLIPEGGYGVRGRDGAATILDPSLESFTHIFCACGTGTTLAGLVSARKAHQTVYGIPVLKNLPTLSNEINALLRTEDQNAFQLLGGYEFGGYARHKPELLQFMNDWYRHTGIPTDFVYTGKLFYAVNDLIRHDSFPSSARLLVIHSGGLQGNRSLPKGTLIF